MGRHNLNHPHIGCPGAVEGREAGSRTALHEVEIRQRSERVIDDNIQRVFRQAGIIRTTTIEELFDVATLNDPAQIKDALARQACNPVRWVEVINAMAASGVTHVAECGPRKVLAGLTKRINGALQGLAIADAATLEQSRQALEQSA